MSEISDRLVSAVERQRREALLFCCAYGARGGKFRYVRWANGEVMAEAGIPEGTLNGEPFKYPVTISRADLHDLIASAWKIIEVSA